MKLLITVGKNTLELSVEEARELYNELGLIFNKSTPDFPHKWERFNPYWDWSKEPIVKYIITDDTDCSNQTKKGCLYSGFPPIKNLI